MKGQRRHVCAKRDFGRRPVEKFSANFACVFDGDVRLGARGIRPVTISVVMIKIVAHLLDDVSRRLRAAGTVEVRDWETIVYSIEGGELLSYFSYGLNFSFMFEHGR